MRKLLIIIGIGAAAAGALAQAENPQVRREIEQVYFQLDRLAEKGDVRGMMSMISPDIVVMDVNGKVTGWNELRAMTRQMARASREVKMNTRIDNIQTQGPEVVAWTTTTANYLQRRNGVWVPMQVTSKCAHTLKRINGKWMFIAAQNLPKDG